MSTKVRMSSRNKLAVYAIFATLLAVFVWTCTRVNVRSPAQIYSNLNIPDSRLLQARNINKSSKPRVLCLVLTAGNQTENLIKVATVNSTWGRRCDKLLFVRGANISNPIETGGTLTVALKEENRDELWHKVTKAFTFVHRNYLDSFDWFMKADDDTYVLVDSLGRFLSRQDTNKPIYFGHKFKPYVKQGYMSGGAGYVLSRAALDQLVRLGFSDPNDMCHLTSGTVEDVEMGWCLEQVGVEAGDSRDETRRPTFNAMNPEYLIAEQQNDNSSWYSRYNYYNTAGLGKNCCSSDPISFHYVTPNEMLLLDWIIYEVKPRREQMSQAN